MQFHIFIRRTFRLVRKFEKKRRNLRNRKYRPIIAISVEGNNVTEKQYFESFNSQQSPYIVKTVHVGGKTDPKKLKQELQDYWKENDLDINLGDQGFVIVDLDCDNQKGRIIESLGSNIDGCRILVSNPCFEVWFLQHNKYSTHAFANSDEVISEARRMIPGYSKTTNVYPLLRSNTEIAIKNAQLLEKHFDSIDARWPSNECNPRTDVWKLAKLLIAEKQN